MFNLWKPDIWKNQTEHHFEHPWRETLWVLIAALLTIGIGQLYTHQMLLPEGSVTQSPIAGSVNQIIIFSPFFLLLLVRRQPLSTAWLPGNSIVMRLLIGLALALCSIITFLLIRQPQTPLRDVLWNVYNLKNVGYAVQIFFEDVAIAMLFVRLQSAIGEKWFLAIVLSVAFLFSASHYPLHLSDGLSFLAATREVIINAVLVSAVIYVVQRSQDILWFWSIHFAMDMMQFYGGSLTA